MSFKSEQAIPERRRAGASLSRALADPRTLNAPIDDIESIKQHIGRNLGPDATDWVVVLHFLGKIYNTSAGGPKFPNDPRYEVMKLRIGGALDTDDLLFV